MSSSFEPWQPPEWLKNSTVCVLFLGIVGLNGYRVYQEWPVHEMRCTYQPTEAFFPDYRPAGKPTVFDTDTTSKLKLRRDGTIVGTNVDAEGKGGDVRGSWTIKSNNKGATVWHVDFREVDSKLEGRGEDFSFDIQSDLNSPSIDGGWTPDDVKASMFIDARCSEVD